MKQGIKVMAAAMLSLILVACGGSGSSSSGAVTTFAGTETITVSVANVATIPPQTSVFPLAIQLTDSAVKIIDIDGTVFKGVLKGNSFSASAKVPAETIDGIACNEFTVTYSGTLDSGSITGNSSGRFTCSLSGTSVQFLVQGTFTVSRTTHSRMRGQSRRAWIKHFVRNI